MPCADPEGEDRGSESPPHPGKSRVIWVSIEISICPPPFSGKLSLVLTADPLSLAPRTF